MKTTSVFVTAVTLLSVGLFSHSNESVAKDLVIDSLVPGSPMNVLHTRLATLTKKYTSHKMQVSMGSPPPKSAVDAAKGSVDFFLYSPLINTFMKNQKAMYAKLKSAKELHSKLRGIVAHNGGIYAFITYADSGIKTIKDFKGKKLYMGPFGGAASRMGVGIIKSVTGYTQKDYQQSRLGISAGGQAFQDGQVDVWMIPNPHPTPVVEQFALTRKIRVIGVPEDKWSTPGLQRLLKLPG